MTGRARDEPAVSAIVGSLLMVAITVALAGITYAVLVHAKRPDSPANVALATEPEEPSAVVLRADPGLDWFNDVVVTGTCVPLLNGGPFPTEPGTWVRAGDELECASGEELIVSSSAGHGNVLLYQKSF